jgi:hypothetical protein
MQINKAGGEQENNPHSGTEKEIQKQQQAHAIYWT